MTKIQPLCQPQWTRRLLIVAMSAAVSSQALALEAITDEELSVTTGEGIAFLPENVSLRMNGADTNNSGAGTFDTGYIRIIPVGPLTPAAAASGAGKGDIFLYGAAISQSAQAYGAARTTTDSNTRFSGLIDSWGTAENPWVLKVETQTGVPDFAAATPTATSTGTVSYLGLEAPLYHNNLAPLSAAEKSAYNLKVAFWTDAFVRNPSIVENMTATGTQFDVGGAGRANRLRLQAIWDGFSVNGSEVKIFQTLGGAVTAVNGMSSSYNNTLGIAGTLRLNSGDAQTLRATVTNAGSSRVTGALIDHNTGGASAPFGCGNNSIDFGTSVCQYRFRSQTVTDSVTDVNWAIPTLSSVFRLSTRETSNTGLLTTPAINGGNAPTFDASEGLFAYNLNMNLVLGSLYQPLTIGVAPDGKNISLELTRIANKESIYKQIYTNYADSNSATNGGYSGSTCNIYVCGSTRTLGGITYQGSTATHSSITIGSTEYDAATNKLTAHSGAGAIGVSFGQLQSRFQAGTFSTQRLRLEYQQRESRIRNGVFTDTYRLRDDGLFGTQTDPFGHPDGDCDGGGLGFGTDTCNRYYNRQGSHVDWVYLNSDAGGIKVFGDRGGEYTALELFGVAMPGGVGGSGTTNTPGTPFVRGLYDCPAGNLAGNCDGSAGGTGSGIYGVGITSFDPRTTNRDWTLTTARNTTWFTASNNQNSEENLAFRTALPAYANIPTATIPATATANVNPSALNNLGSAVIDGLLIQHLKFSTKGL